MPFEMDTAGFESFLPILFFIIWIVRTIAKANKKNENKRNTNPRQNQQNQPGKSIEDILRELEQRANGRTPEIKEPAAPSPPQPVTEYSEYENRHAKTVEEFKEESHSDMAKHHVTEEELHDGKFDEIDDRLLHLENFEADEHETIANTLLNAEDIRKAIILNAVLNRPEY